MSLSPTIICDDKDEGPAIGAGNGETGTSGINSSSGSGKLCATVTLKKSLNAVCLLTRFTLVVDGSSSLDIS